MENLLQNLKQLVVALNLLSVALAAPATYSIVPALVIAPRGQVEASQVDTYVRQMAVYSNINPDLASCLVKHESQDGWQEGYYDPALAGHEPNGTISWGVWQFNAANKGFDKACATDLECSTKMAMDWINAGKVKRWSTYADFCKSIQLR